MGAIAKLLLVLSLLSMTIEAHAQPKKIQFSQIDKGFQALIMKLRKAVADRDSRVIYAALAWDYIIERDFGGVYLEYERPKVNFSTTYQFDDSKMFPEYKDSGWRRFEIDISSNSFERMSDTEICTPHGATDHEPLPIGQLCFEKRFLLGWRIAKHINGGD